MRHGCDVFIRVFKLFRDTTSCGEKRPWDSAVAAQDEYDGGVGDGLGTCGCRVTVDDVTLGEGTGVDPVESCAG